MMRAVLAGRIRQRVGRASVERDAPLGGARMSAPQFQIQFGARQSEEAFRHLDLQQAAGAHLGALAELGMEDHFGCVDAERRLLTGLPCSRPGSNHHRRRNRPWLGPWLSGGWVATGIPGQARASVLKNSVQAQSSCFIEGTSHAR